MKTRILFIAALMLMSISSVSNAQQLDDTETEYLALTHDLKSNSIPEEVFERKKLTTLSINGMNCDINEAHCWKIKTIPPQIAKLKNLEVLNFYFNAITTIPPELGELKKLRSVVITDDPQLKNIDNIVLVKNLEYLQLDNCDLTNLPLNIGVLTKLKFLLLNGNNFSKAEQARIKHALPKCKVDFKGELSEPAIPMDEVNKLIQLKKN